MVKPPPGGFFATASRKCATLNHQTRPDQTRPDQSASTLQNSNDPELRLRQTGSAGEDAERRWSCAQRVSEAHGSRGQNDFLKVATVVAKLMAHPPMSGVRVPPPALATPPWWSR